MTDPPNQSLQPTPVGADRLSGKVQAIQRPKPGVGEFGR